MAKSKKKGTAKAAAGGAVVGSAAVAAKPAKQAVKHQVTAAKKTYAAASAEDWARRTREKAVHREQVYDAAPHGSPMKANALHAWQGAQKDASFATRESAHAANAMRAAGKDAKFAASQARRASVTGAVAGAAIGGAAGAAYYMRKRNGRIEKVKNTRRIQH